MWRAARDFRSRLVFFTCICAFFAFVSIALFIFRGNSAQGIAAGVSFTVTEAYDAKAKAMSGTANLVTGSACLAPSAGDSHQIGFQAPPSSETSFDVPVHDGSDGILRIYERGHLGKPLPTKSLSVHVIIDGRVALTRIDQVFANPTDRRLEGRYSFSLPSGAVLSRYAMFTSDTRMVEGEILERDRARGIYTNIVRRQRDPALVEWQQGNLFSARIFPVEPKSCKRVLLSYTQLLTRRFRAAEYTFPLHWYACEGYPIDELDVAVEFAGKRLPENVRFHSIPGLLDDASWTPSVLWRCFKTQAAPGAALRISLAYPRSSGPELICHRLPGDEQGFFLLALPPSQAFSAEIDLPCDLTVFLDTSFFGSAFIFEKQIKALEYLLSQLSARDRFRVFGFNVNVRPIGKEGFSEAIDENRSSSTDAVREILPLGGMNTQNLFLALNACRHDVIPGRRSAIILIGDGMGAVGDRRFGNEMMLLEGHALAHECPVHCLAIGNPVNHDLHQGIARRTDGMALHASDSSSFYQCLRDLTNSLRTGRIATEVNTKVTLNRASLAGASLDLAHPFGSEVLAKRFLEFCRI